MDRNLRIIMAEDDPINQKVTQLTLKKIGLRAEAAANGIEVLHYLERQPYFILHHIKGVAECSSLCTVVLEGEMRRSSDATLA